MSLPTHPCIQFPEVPGRHKSTTFIMDKNPSSYAFLVETVDEDLFELTIFTIDDEGGRTEHVIHCPSQGLILLSQAIATTLYQHNKIKEHLPKD